MSVKYRISLRSLLSRKVTYKTFRVGFNSASGLLGDICSFGMTVIMKHEVKQDFIGLQYTADAKRKPAASPSSDVDTLPELSLDPFADSESTAVSGPSCSSSSSAAVSSNGNARRRRVSSCSSDCSSDGGGAYGGSRKAVSFSHPISESKDIDEVQASMKANKSHEKLYVIPSRSCLKDDSLLDGGEPGDDFDESSRWEARFEDMLSINPSKLKRVCWGMANAHYVEFSYEQHHLLVGHGGLFSTVYLSLTEVNDRVAVKKFNVRKADLLNDPETIKKLLALTSHPGLLDCHKIIQAKPNFFLVSELAEFSLEQVFALHSIFQLPASIPVCFQQLVAGLNHLHDNDILHRNIRPSNVLVSRHGTLKLGDFGLHTSGFFHAASTPAAVRCWLSSEVLKKAKTTSGDLFTKTSDVSSLGMVFYYMLSNGCHPFGELCGSADVTLANIIRGSYNLKLLSTQPYAHHLVKSMLYKETNKRYTLAQVSDHPYFIDDAARAARFDYITKTYKKYRVYAGEQLAICSREILTMYAERSNLTLKREQLKTIQDLFNIVQHCLDDPRYIHQISHKYHDERRTVQQFFMETFPGIVLSTYDVLRALTLHMNTLKSKSEQNVVTAEDSKEGHHRELLHHGEGDSKRTAQQQQATTTTTCKNTTTTTNKNGYHHHSSSSSNKQCEVR